MTPKRKRPGRPTQQQVTDAQRQALSLLGDFIARNGYPPTMQELGKLLSISGASAHQLVLQLERKGYVTRQPRQARSLKVVREPNQEPKSLVEVPILGRVAAGPGMLAEENVEGQVMVEGSLVGRGSCFALIINGDSMIDAGIDDGDIVIVRQQPVAENGEIVVALLGDEATVKRLFIQGDRIELRPENKRYKPIPISGDQDSRILGKVIAIRHSVGK